MPRVTRCSIIWLLFIAGAAAAQPRREPIIDVHVHSFGPQLGSDGQPARMPCLNDRVGCANPPSRFTTNERSSVMS
jgi:hypothetical protein